MIVSASVSSQPDAQPADLLEQAVALYREQGPEKSLEYFERILNLSFKPEDRLLRIRALRYLGECHWRLGEFETSRRYLDEGLELASDEQAEKEQGDLFNVYGLLEWDSGNFDQAMSYFDQAGYIAIGLHDRQLEAMALNNRSLVMDELGQYRAAIENYKQVLSIYEEIDFPRGRGDTLGNLGGTHLLLGHFTTALGYYQQALQISQSLGSEVSLSQDHGNIALCYLGIGQNAAALDHFDRAIIHSGNAGLRLDEAYWMNSKGSALIRAGHYDQGLKSHRQALAVYEEIGAQAERLEALHELGQLFLTLGDIPAAEANFRESMQLAREIGQARGITNNLLALGELKFRRELYSQAEELYDEAIRRSESEGERSTLTLSLLKKAEVEQSLGRYDQSDQLVEQALEISIRTGSRPLEARALYLRAENNRLRDRYDLALVDYNAVQVMAAESVSPEIDWQVFYGQARVHEARGDLESAIRSLESAVRVIDGVRDRLRENRFRSGYIQDKHDVYVDLVRLQLAMGLHEEAFSTAERLRARGFSRLAEPGDAAELNEDQKQERHELRERIQKMHQQLAQEQIRDSQQQRQSAIDSFSHELILAEQEYQTFIDDHGIRQPFAATASPVNSSLEIRSQLHDNEALIEYVVAQESVIIFVIKADSLHVVSSNISYASLATRVALLRDLVRQPDNPHWIDPAGSLAEVLVNPIMHTNWLDGIEQLILIPHDVLNHLPFSVLQAADRKTPLVEHFDLTYLPSAAAFIRHSAVTDPEKSMLALAPARSRLQFAPEEASSVRKLFHPNARLLQGRQATESSFKSLAGDYGMLHLATHGHFNQFNPLLSRLELEADEYDDGMLEVHEILNLKLNAHLVTLSACDTALGSGFLADVPAGDELIGLTGAFLTAGADFVMATLWEVDDRSSIRLMLNFYGTLTKQEPQSSLEPSLARSLNRAQRMLRARDATHHPYYWAPFILVGSDGHGPSTPNNLSET